MDGCACGLESEGCVYPRCPEGDWQECPDCGGNGDRDSPGACPTCHGHGIVRVAKRQMRATGCRERMMDETLLPSERLGWIKATKHAAAIADKWRTPSHIRLHAGEMTAQELRSVQAVAQAIASEIRSGCQ